MAQNGKSVVQKNVAHSQKRLKIEKNGGLVKMAQTRKNVSHS